MLMAGLNSPKSVREQIYRGKKRRYQSPDVLHGLSYTAVNTRKHSLFSAVFLVVSQDNAIFLVYTDGPFLIRRIIRYVLRAEATSKPSVFSKWRHGLPTNHTNIQAVVRGCSNGWALKPSRRYLRPVQYGAAATWSTCDIYSSACFIASVQERAGERPGWKAQCSVSFRSRTKCMEPDSPH